MGQMGQMDGQTYMVPATMMPQRPSPVNRRHAAFEGNMQGDAARCARASPSLGSISTMTPSNSADERLPWAAISVDSLPTVA
mmetsp:Transcript_47597/g.151920  ORF Transcript_47597/g.151920 Transcript_47597/m.151920 type:complete len:82 (+) Transcript_47597:3-248(+)